MLNIDDPVELRYKPEYRTLAYILHSAYKRAALGKGKERHATANQLFEEQPIVSIPRQLAGGSVEFEQDVHTAAAAVLFQAVKKIYESQRLPNVMAQGELLDAIVYIAAAVQLHYELGDAEQRRMDEERRSEQPHID